MKTLLPFLLSAVVFAHAGEIHEAAAKGDAGRVRALLKKDRQLLNARDFRGHATPLAVAVVACQPECVRVLLEAGADVNESGDDVGATPLILAVGSLDKDGSLLVQVAKARRMIEQLAEGTGRREAQAKLEESEKKLLTPELRAKIPMLPLPAAPERIEILNMLLKRKPDLKAKDKQGRSAMHFAAVFASAEVVELLIANGGDANLRSRDWRTPLHDAAEAANLESAAILVKKGAQCDASTNDGATALHFAAANGSMPLVELLLAQAVQADAQDERGTAPLHLAAQAGRTGIATRLLAAGTDVSIIDLQGMTPLHYASSYGRIETVGMLLQRGAKLEHRDNAGFTPLIYAAERGQMHVFETLLAKGADPKARTKNGLTALHFACGNPPSTEWIERLIAAGIAVDARDDQRFTPLHNAALWGRRAAVEMLLQHGAEVNALTANGLTPLQFAADAGGNLRPGSGAGKASGQGTPEDYREICELIATKGARLDVVTNDGWTLLHSAAATGSIDLARRVLAAGVSAAAKDTKGKTPLHLAAVGGHTAVAELLLKSGASAGAVDEDGDTPLHHAANRSPDPEMIPLLVKHGATLNLANRNFKATPLNLAAAFANLGAVKALLALGADVSIGDSLGDTPLHNAANITDRERLAASGSASRALMAKLDKHTDPAAAMGELKRSPFAAELQQELDADLAAARKSDRPARCLEITRLLLEHGASPVAKNHNESTPIDASRKVGTPEIVRLLENQAPATRKPRKP